MNLIWGANAIAKALGRTERATFHMLEHGQIPGARKVGGRWCFDPEVFRGCLRRAAGQVDISPTPSSDRRG